ncbi:MAG: hypothetical protein CMK09_07015 [Ponticaulis sp.]|mgnify:CR=1 FL=1|nr:hypothetical protein [Ponticaulis sp.]|tara:strand:- start:55587 stop:56690 length:1104 start_codon:yes stop_codon:yes gene_type:complete
MSGELETGALASAGALSGGKPGGAPEDQSCRNCGAEVNRRYCGNCGQLAQNFHRPIWGLVSEVMGDFLSLDGRVMRTLPALMFKPGRVTRSYLDGKRQRFVPPFRLYLLTSFLYFLLLFAYGDSEGWFEIRYATPGQPGFSQVEGEAGRGLRFQVTGDLDELSDEIGASPEEEVSDGDGEVVEPEEPWLLEDGRVNRHKIDNTTCDLEDEEMCGFVHYALNRIADAYENQGMLYASIQAWAPRVALALTPILILLLILLYPFSKRHYVYDHVISALHVQSWLYILHGIGLLFFWLGQMWFVLVLLIAPVIYFYRMFRVVYHSGRILSVVRTIIVLNALTAVFFVLFTALAILSVAETSPVLGGLSQN